MKMNSKSWFTDILDRIRSFICSTRDSDISDIEVSYIKNIDQVFFNLNKELSEARDKNTIYRKISDAVIKIFGCDEVDIYVWDQEKEGLVLENFFLKDRQAAVMPYNFMPLSFFPKIKEIIKKDKNIVNGWDILIDESESYSNIFDFSSSLIGPFYEKKKFRGVMFVIWRDEKMNFTDHEMRIFNSILNYLSNALTQSVLYNEVMSLAVIDTLTGLYNRRFFDEALKREYERAKRYNRNLSLVIFDINDFKYINDNFGHLTGDMVLREISRIIKENIRSIDIPVRYGGDELVLILPETSFFDTKLTVNKIRKKLKEWSATSPIDGFNGEITISAGWADINEVKTPEALIELADERMYEDKRAYKEKKAQMREDSLSNLG